MKTREVQFNMKTSYDRLRKILICELFIEKRESETATWKDLRSQLKTYSLLKIKMTSKYCSTNTPI